MAKIRERGGHYFLDYYFRGRRIRKAVGPSRRVAEQILKDIEGRRVRDDAGLSVVDVTGDQALTEFLEDSRARNSPKHVKHQERIIRDLLDYASVRRLRQLTARIIERWQRKRAAETSPFTARGNVVTVRSWLRWAKRSGYLQADPSDDVKKLPAPARGEIEFVSEQEAEALLKACQDSVPLLGPGRKGSGTTRPRKTPLHEMAAVALYAGLRLGEILHLYWEDVDFKSNGGVLHVRVRESFVPKDKEGRRIPLHSRLKKILRAYQKKAKGKEGLIFQTSNGTVFEGRNVVRELQKAADRAGIEDGCNFYLLRHTFASWLTMKGVSLHKIAKFLGHSSVTTTERHYAGLVPETLHEDIEKLGG